MEIKIRLKEEEQKAPVEVAQPFKTLDELDDELVYGVYANRPAAFGCEFRPATGKELKQKWTMTFDCGAVRRFRSSKLHRESFLLKIPSTAKWSDDNAFVEAQLYRGYYDPPKEKRLYYHFSGTFHLVHKVKLVPSPPKRRIFQAK